MRQQNIIYLNNKIIYGRGFQNQIGDKLVAFGVFKGFANLNRRYLPFFVWILIFAANVFWECYFKNPFSNMTMTRKTEITEEVADIRGRGRIRFTFFRLNDTRFDPNSTRV